MKEEGQDFKEKVTIDEVAQTETFHADAHGKNDEVDAISDFKEVRVFLCMHYLSNSS